MSLKVCPQCNNEYELDVRFCPLDGSTLRAKSAGNDLVGTVVAERYEVLKKLGEGGMGQVYLAQHIRIKRKSALKIMHPSMVHDPDAISRFYREAENASKISHTNVAAIYDFGETSDGLIYLAMEFVEGQALTALIEKQGALPARRAAEITRQAAEALGVAHDMGIVHRDLKPDNIMIAPGRDGADLVKVVDFGIAKVADNESQKVTKTGLVVGTPEYMSPEQLAGDKLDGRSDIYSLALVAFNMFTGRLPFPSETVQESMIMRLTDRPRTLREMKPDVAWPPELEEVMVRALQRDSALRYQRAADFGKAIARAVEHMPEKMTAAEATMVLGAVSAPGAPAGPGAPAVPPTLVAGAAGGAAPAAGATAAMGAMPGATRALGAEPLPHPAPTPPPVPAPTPVAPSPMPRAIGLGIGGVVAVGVLAYAGVMLFKKADDRVTPDTAAAAPAGQVATVPAGAGGGPAAATPQSSVTNPVTNPAGGPAVTPGGARPSNPTPGPSAAAPAAPVNVTADLQLISKALEADSASIADEASTLQLRIDRVLARRISGSDSALALYYRSMLYLSQGNTTRACPVLERLRVDERRGEDFARGVDAAYRHSCQ